MADFGLTSLLRHANVSLLKRVNSLRPFTSKAPVNLADWGGVVDGVTDDTLAITLALDHARTDQTAGNRTGVEVGPNHALTRLKPWELIGRFLGEGQLLTGDGKLRGRMFARRATEPTSYGSQDGIGHAFSGDLSTVHHAIEHRIDGAATLTQPAAGYVFHAENSAVIHQFQNTSGYNALANDQGGRTGVAFVSAHVAQLGQGDAVHTSVTGIVEGTRAGSTHFLANPAVLIMDGGLYGFTDGTYQQVDEFGHNDAGFDVAVSSTVRNFYRTNSTGAKGAWWLGTRYQSSGSKPVDVAFQVVGKWKNVFDTTRADLGSTQAAFTLAAGQRIYLAATNTDYYANPAMTQPGPHWLDFNTASGQVQLVYDGIPALLVSARGVEANLLKPVTNWYSASGDIAATDTLAVLDHDDFAYFILGAGPANGHEMAIKRIGDGTAVIRLPLDGWADSVVTLGCCVLKEALHLNWSERQEAWLLISAIPSAGALLHVQYGSKRTRAPTTDMVSDRGTARLVSAGPGELAHLGDTVPLAPIARLT